VLSAWYEPLREMIDGRFDDGFGWCMDGNVVDDDDECG